MLRFKLLLLALAPCAALAGEPATVADPIGPAPGEAAAPPSLSTTSAEAPDPTTPAPTSPAPAAATAKADLAALPPPPLPPPPDAPYPRWGLFLGVGVPQASQLSLIYRPVPLVRLHAGPSYSYLGFGLHGGVTLTPIRWAITPTLGVEVGQFRTFDVTKVVSSIDQDVRPLLQRVSLKYAAALLGFEFGSQRGFSFVLRAGLTYLAIDSRGSAVFTGGGVSGGNTARIVVTDPKIRGTAPTLQLGFQYFF